MTKTTSPIERRSTQESAAISTIRTGAGTPFRILATTLVAPVSTAAMPSNSPRACFLVYSTNVVAASPTGILLAVIQFSNALR